MSKILLFSDIHIHAHKGKESRLQDCLDALYWVFHTARERNIKDVVFAGDLFQDRTNIKVYTYHQTYKVFTQFSDLNIWLLLGNHDLWYSEKADISSVIPIGALSYVNVIDKPTTLNIAGIDIDFLPYTQNPIAVLADNFDARAPILVGHIAVDGATLNFNHNIKAEVSVEYENDMIPVSKDLFDGYQKVFLGHYHGAQKLNNVVEYIGSTLQLNFGEANQDKHIMVFDTETLDVEYIKNTFSPKHYIIKAEEVDKYDLGSNFFNVIIDDIGHVDILEMKAKLTKESDATFHFIHSKSNQVEDKLNQKFDLIEGDVLERYVKTIEHSLDESMLLRIGKEICIAN